MNTPATESDSEKAQLRRDALARRAKIRDEEGKAAARAAAQTFLEKIDRAPEAVVALYWPIRGELDTKPLLTRLIDSGAPVCLPVVAGDDQPLIFRLWDGQSPLDVAGFGTMAPGPDAPEAVPDLMVMPLAAYDKTGHRLGYGKGFYDRTLAAMAAPPLRIGYGFSIQQVDRVPAEAHDVALDVIITEQGLTRFA